MVRKFVLKVYPQFTACGNYLRHVPLGQDLIISHLSCERFHNFQEHPKRCWRCHNPSRTEAYARWHRHRHAPSWRWQAVFECAHNWEMCGGVTRGSAVWRREVPGVSLRYETGSDRPSDYSAQTQCSQEALSNGMDKVRYCRDMISRMRSVPPKVTGSERVVGTQPKEVSAITDLLLIR